MLVYLSMLARFQREGQQCMRRTISVAHKAARPPASEISPALPTFTETHPSRRPTKEQVRLAAVRKTKTMSVSRNENARVDDVNSPILAIREQVRNRVETAIRKRFGPRYTIQLFGSTRYGVSYANSDLDMVILDSTAPQGFSKIEGLAPVYNPRHVANCLRRPGFVDINLRPYSAVPLVRFKDPKSRMECDLNVNECLGVINSDMIKDYCDFFPPLRSMLFSVKEWAKPLGLNSPSIVGAPASFSSYALVLMTIGFLQKRGLLPNFQANLEPLTDRQKRRYLVWTKKPHQCWDTRYTPSRMWVAPAGVDPDELLRGWFLFWAEFPYETEVLSIRDGGTVSRGMVLSPEGQTHQVKTPPFSAPIAVADPFIKTKNVTVSVSKGIMNRFVSECRNRVSTLVNATCSESTAIVP